jgi:hypothetical protein
VVQIIALRQAFAGNYALAWTGSGTIIHPQGVILTNCHVANPQAMGTSVPTANVLAAKVRALRRELMDRPKNGIMHAGYTHVRDMVIEQDMTPDS